MSKTNQQKLAKIQENQDLQNFQANLNRARSINVGTCFGGTTEILMRANDGSCLWCVMQPVEVVELIHQLAANIGCHIHIQPRKDFSSWRDWRVTEAEKKHLNGWPPFVNDMAPDAHRGAILPPPEMQPGLKIERNEHEPVATKKIVKRRSTKRATTTA